MVNGSKRKRGRRPGRPRKARAPAIEREPVKTRADRAIEWIETFCRIPEGPAVGQPVRLRSWQRDILRDIYDNPAGTRRAIISFARKNGKTSLVAFIMLLHLCGDECVPNSHIYSAAQSRDQAGILFGLAAKVVRLSPRLAAHVTVRDHAKELEFRQAGTSYKALSAEVATAFGLSPALIIHDELGQVRGPRSELYDALETATAAYAEPLSIIISTQAPNDSDLLSMLIDDAMSKADPRTVIRLFTAAPSLDPFSEDAMRAANPAWGDFQNAGEVKAMAAQAQRMPAGESAYRNLYLNQRVAAAARFVQPSQWKACEAAPGPLEGVPVYGGLDLSVITDLTACILMGRRESVWHVHPTFWLPGDGLAERARRDRAPYDLWAQQGFIEPVPGRTIDYEFVAHWLREQFERYEIAKLGFDMWNFTQLKPWLLRAEFTEEQIERHFVPFGQGFKSMSPALLALEAELVNARIAHGGHPVLTMCADAAVVTSDPAGNRKLNKAKSVRRIDGLVALTMAFGVAAIERDKTPDYELFALT